MKISVIICAHTEKRWEDLQESIESVMQQTLPPLQIVAAIDHNPSLMVKVAAKYPAITVVENSQESGLNGTRNSGVAVAAGEIVAFLDDDAVADPDWLEQLAASYTSSDIAGVGGKINPFWTKQRPDWLPEEFYWVVGCSYRGLPTQSSPVRNLIGCNMSFRRSVIEKLDGFRNGIGHVGGRPQGDDETEFCIRLRQAMPESILLYQPKAQVRHKVPAARANWEYYRWRCYLEGRSKALLSRIVGPNDGLASERSYTLKILPGGVWTGIAESFRNRNWKGLSRSAAITAGFAITTFGYGLGSLLLLNQKIGK